MTQMHGEMVPGEEDSFFGYMFHGLKEIRTRRDGSLLIGLCLDKARKTVIVLMDEQTGVHLVESVEPENANQAFVQPFAYVSEAGQGLLRQTLELKKEPGEDFLG